MPRTFPAPTVTAAATVLRLSDQGRQTHSIQTVRKNQAMDRAHIAHGQEKSCEASSCSGLLEFN